tara:strand:- start:81 stop:596 length:516 start_codon:yes stop_codon:yes gene_type:complete
MKNKTVKILATIGLVIAIFLILRGVFDIGKIGFKNFSSKLPILKCEIYDTDGSKKIEFYDLEKIKNNDPTQNMSKEQDKKLSSRENLDIVTLFDQKRKEGVDAEYRINYEVHVDGIDKGYFVVIKKDSGEFEAWFPTHIRVADRSWETTLKSMREAQIFKGSCDEVKRKKL